MKSTFFSLLPLAGLALAESVCEQRTVTKTEYEYSSVTVTPLAGKQPIKPEPTTCSRSTVTTTMVEKVTVTVQPSNEGPETIDVTSTSTKYMETTVTVRPSMAPSAASSDVVSVSAPASQGGNTPVAASSAPAEARPTSELPDFSVIGQAQPTKPAEQPAAPAPKPSSKAQEAPAPASSAAAPASSAPAEKPAESSTSSTSAAGSKRGEATFYGGNVDGGMCSFTGYTIPSSLYGTALSDTNWGGASACGQCVSVTGPSGTKVTAMVVDQCPGCGSNHLDLFPDAFKKLADPSKGVIPVSWDFVPCGITSPIVLKNKSGTSKFWFSMQVMNANVGVAKLEVSTDGGSTWKATTRQPYNFFENAAGFGTESVDVKVTSVDGKEVVVKAVGIQSGALKTAGGNF